MALNEIEREGLLKYLANLSDDELAGYVEKASQSARFNPDVKERQEVGIQYARGTRVGRKKYAEAKAAGEEGLAEVGEIVEAEQARRAEAAEQDEKNRRSGQREANRKGILGIRDEPDEEGLTMQEVVEKRIAEQEAVSASDTNQLQRELGGIDPEAMQAARADRDRASRMSVARGVRNSLNRLDREAEAGFARADQELAIKDSLNRLDREAEAGFARADQELADADAARAREGEEELRGKAIALFPKIMGSSFDPNSSMDRGKLDIIIKAKQDHPDLSPNQLALKIYRDYMP